LVKLKKIGVLALQGGFDPHLRVLRTLGVESGPVRTLDQILGCDGLVIPGGESTTIGKLLVLLGLMDPVKTLIEDGLPVFGTCAGLILLSKNSGRDQPLLGVLDVDVARNAYGQQKESFETTLPFDDGTRRLEVPGVFIRAPQIVRLGPGVSTLASYEGLAVCVRQGAVLASSFHPELTSAPALHDYFLSLV
jgi:5'-phosphate synthase pdxT subunit